MRYLLDSNTCIAAMRNHPHVVARMKAVPPGACAISTVTSYELFTGVEKCAKPTVERVKVELLLRSLTEIGFDSEAARKAASIRAALESQGQTIGPYDLLLAGQAIVLQLVLVTNNTREFSRVPTLDIEDWHSVSPTP